MCTGRRLAGRAHSVAAVLLAARALVQVPRGCGTTAAVAVGKDVIFLTGCLLSPIATDGSAAPRGWMEVGREINGTRTAPAAITFVHFCSTKQTRMQPTAKASCGSARVPLPPYTCLHASASSTVITGVSYRIACWPQHQHLSVGTFLIQCGALGSTGPVCGRFHQGPSACAAPCALCVV
jgi:hypothetical protein